MRLKDKVILVTGSTTGIGEGIARRFVAEGAKVILHGRNVERGNALQQELGPENAAFCQGDLGDAEYPDQLAKDGLAVFGRIDGLVNNAGLVTRSRFVDTDAVFFDRIMAVSEVSEEFNSTTIRTLLTGLTTSLNLGLLFYYNAKLALIALLLGLLVGWGIAQYEKSMVRAGQARLALIQRETDALTRDIQEMRNFRQLRERMLKQIDLIGELQSSRPLTIRVLDQMAATLVDGVHYTELNRRGSRLELSGVATSNRQVSDQMRALDNSSAFDIPLLSDVQSAEGPAAAKRFHMSVDEHLGDDTQAGAGP